METNHAVVALSALAQENRLEIFRLLVQAGAKGLPAGKVAEQLDIPAPTLSFHLSQLKHAGLVHARRDGRSLIYAANYDGMNALVGFLMQNCCGGDVARCDLSACDPASARVTRKGATKR